MALLEGFFDFLIARPWLVVLGCLAYVAFYAFSVALSGPKPGKNPFAGDTRQPQKLLVHDRTLRDKVIKQGFIHKRIPEKIDAIVIGSGISGLTAAALLAKTGKSVLVLEQHDQAGGCCHTFYEKGFEFDVGIHYIGEMQSRGLTRTLFEQISDGQVRWEPLDTNFDTVSIGKPGETRDYPLLYGKTQFRQSLVDSFPNDVEAIDTFLAMLKKARRVFMYFVLLKSLPYWLAHWVAKLRLLDLFTDYTKLGGLTTQAYLDSITNNKDLKAVLAYSFGDYGTCPDESSILMHALLLNHYMYSAAYPVGGASEIAYNIIPVIERAGGRVLVRANVTDILCENGRAVGVAIQKGGENIVLKAKLIISAAGLYNTLNLLPESIRIQSRYYEANKDKQVKSGVGALSLFVGLNGTKEELGLKAQNVWAFTDNDLNKAFRSYYNTTPDIDNPDNIPLLFISFPSTKDPTWDMRAPGKSVCTVVTLANYEWFSKWNDEKVMHRGDDYEALKDSLAKQMWKQVVKFYPQLADKVEYMELGSPVTNNYYIRSTKGEIYGLDHNKGRFDPHIAVNMRPDSGIKGLYVTGQDIVTCGFAGAMFSGLATVSAILHRNLFDDLTKLNKTIKKKELAQKAAQDKKSD